MSRVETVGPVFSEMRTTHHGPVVISQDLTVFNVTAEPVVARQAVVDPVRWPVVGPTLEPPAWWADALITG
ncbi:MAG: hypothetical protein MUF83_18540 [Acidimicrobiales bacterium]|jgi:ribonuclease Z|nr:hypothetical protein [Acidimicrobiales bacterium]